MDVKQTPSSKAVEKICSAAVQLNDFKYLYDLKNVCFVLVKSTETEHSMRPLVSPSLSKKNILERCTEQTDEPKER